MPLASLDIVGWTLLFAQLAQTAYLAYQVRFMDWSLDLVWLHRLAIALGWSGLVVCGVALVYEFAQIVNRSDTTSLLFVSLLGTSFSLSLAIDVLRLFKKLRFIR